MEVAIAPLPLDFDGVIYPGEGGTSKFFAFKWAQKMNKKLPRSLIDRIGFVFWGDRENPLGGGNYSPLVGRGLN